jgi:hypothetical protein
MSKETKSFGQQIKDNKWLIIGGIGVGAALTYKIYSAK